MRPYKFLLFVIVLVLSVQSYAQKIVYSEPEREDGRRMNFEVIGKIGPNFLIYKNVHNKSYIVSYNNEMVGENKEELEYLPTERVINIDFFPYQDFSYMVYEYQKKNIIYCEAVKLDFQGKRVSD